MNLFKDMHIKKAEMKSNFEKGYIYIYINLILKGYI